MTYRFKRTCRMTAVALVIVAAVIGIYLVETYRSTEATLERSLAEVFQLSRPTVGRLFEIPYASHASEEFTTSTALSRAQLLLLTLPKESSQFNELEAYVNIASHRWKNAADTLENLVSLARREPGLTNDLGVVYLELGLQDPSYLIRAFGQFEAALQLDPSLVEPVFNLALTYRLLHLTTDEETTTERLRGLEPESDWFVELARESRGEIIEANSKRESQNLQWQSVLDTSLNPSQDSSDLSLHLAIAEEFWTEYQDLTPTAVLTPLQDERREQVVELRRQVQRAVDAYQEQRFVDSVRLLEQLQTSAAGLESEFDRLWVDLNLAEALVWTPNWAQARTILSSVSESALNNDFKWLLARTLTVFGVHPNLSDSPQQVIERLREAIGIYDYIGADADSVRARFLLAVRLYSEGNPEDSLRLAIEALTLTPPDSHRRRYQSFWIISRSPLLQGSQLSFKYQTETAVRAALADRPDGVAYAHMTLAQLHEEKLDPEAADVHLRTAEKAILAIDSEVLRRLVDIDMWLAKAKILAGRGETSTAERLLSEGLEAVTLGEIDIFYEQRYRMELATVYRARGDEDKAKVQFGLAVEAVEREDDTLESQARLMFDEQRREVYEAAIAFEFGREDMEATRNYAQQYRAKLLTEAFGQYETKGQTFAQRVVSVREGRGELGAGRVIEYTMLKDRLLMWVLSRDSVEDRSYPIARDNLQEKVERFLDLMTDLDRGDELISLAKELHTILINPVIDLLAGADSVTIVPDRMLHRLPFAALLSQEDRYLIEDYVLAETLNAPYFLNLPASSTDTGKLVSIGSQEQISSIRIELAGMDDIYEGIDSFNGPEVDGTLFLDAMNEASLFHYAGHSALDGTNSLSSSILLDGNADGGNAVTALEIADRRLGVNALVVLASCDSSVGNSIGGVGFRGLTLAFLIAGAGSVVGSLWPVESTATTQLMLRFHRDLASGTTIAESLRSAQLSVLAERPHPYFWSGFTVTGNRSALQPAPFVTTVLARATAGPSL